MSLSEIFIIKSTLVEEFEFPQQYITFVAFILRFTYSYFL